MNFNKIRICALSDMHGNIDNIKLNECDIAIIAGDSAPLNGFSKWNIYDQKKWFQNKMMPWIESYPNVQFVIIPGNHDLSLDISKISRYPEINWKLAWPRNAHILIDQEITLFNGIKIYGTPWVPIISHIWAFEAEHDRLQEKFRKIPNGIDILVTHTPPRVKDCGIDWSLQTSNGPFGSDELSQEIFMKQPKYLFCGHIHTGDHECQMFEGCKMYNVSLLDEDYSVKYQPLMINL